MHILSLPRELLLNVVELSSLPSKPPYYTSYTSSYPTTTNKSTTKYDKRTLLLLALVSSHLSQLVEYILYHTLLITSPRSLRLLARTARTESGRKRLERNVENLLIGGILLDGIANGKTGQSQTLRGGVGGHKKRGEDIADILRAVGMVKNVAIDVNFVPTSFSLSPSPSPFPTMTSPRHLTLSSLPTPSSLSSLEALLSQTTHLTFHSPPDKWIDPLPLLLSLPPHTLHHISHLSLPRREHSNTENDLLFLDCISSLLLLSRFDSLQTLLIRIFPSAPGARSDSKAEIWSLLEEFHERVGEVGREKVRVRVGEWDNAWMGEWEADVRGRGDLWK